jgi:hypothetical protein
MGAEHSTQALIKISEGIIRRGIVATTPPAVPPSVIDISSKPPVGGGVAWKYYIEYKSQNGEFFNIFSRTPTPKVFDDTFKPCVFIEDPSGVDADVLKTVAKNEVAKFIYEIQHDDTFTQFLNSINARQTALSERGVGFDEITPISIVNTVNSVFELALTPRLIYEKVAHIKSFPSIGTRAIAVKGVGVPPYPIALADYAARSVQHVYAATLAGLLLSLLENHSASSYLALELKNSSENAARIDSLIFLILAVIFVGLIVIGGYSIFTVLINEAHHREKKMDEAASGVVAHSI